MDWFKLKENKCPKCRKDMMKGLQTPGGGMMIHPCGFRITEKRYTEIVNSTIKQEQLAEKWRKEDEKNKI